MTKHILKPTQKMCVAGSTWANSISFHNKSDHEVVIVSHWTPERRELIFEVEEVR